MAIMKEKACVTNNETPQIMLKTKSVAAITDQTPACVCLCVCVYLCGEGAEGNARLAAVSLRTESVWSLEQ